jgi:predicted O-methyltransferase YrrM
MVLNTSVSVNDFLKTFRHCSIEGNISGIGEQIDTIKKILEEYAPKNILEIGFNAGHSAELFLDNNKDINYLGFDIGRHKYTHTTNEFMKLKYKNRFNLILGDSLETVPLYIKNNNKKYDLIFIDGCHDYINAKSDFENCKKLAHKDTIVILDDVMYNKRFERTCNKGPNKVWNDALDNNEIIQLGLEEYRISRFCRGMTWGKYN